jgi:hypothetical protein
MNAKDSKDLSHRCYKFRKRSVSYRVYILWFSCSQQLLNYLAIQYFDFESAQMKIIRIMRAISYIKIYFGMLIA